MFVNEMVRQATGASYPAVSDRIVYDSYLPLPELREQRRIADVLDRVEALRVRRRVALARVGALIRAIFLDQFGDPAINPKNWPTWPLGALATRFSDGPFGSNLKSSHYAQEGVRVVRLQNIGVGEFLDEDKSYISREHFGSLKKYECRPGDVLVGTLGNPNLRACIHPDWLDIALNKADCVQIRPDTRAATAEYLCWLLNQPSTEGMAHGLILGQTRARISMGRLRELIVPCPPLALQREFSAKLAIVERIKAHQQVAAGELNALFVSLQQRAFRGEL